MKITKHGIKFNVNAYEGSLIGYWIRALLILYLNIKVDNYFRKVKNGTYEEPTFLIMNKYLDKKHSIIDIGAWRGTMTLYACQLARHCYAVEPDPISFNALKSNIELNSEIQDKITVCNAAIFSHTGLVNLSARFAFDQSITSTIKRYDSYNIKIPSFTLPDFVKKYKIDDCNFIKIDTEGAEVAILPKAFEFLKNKKPVIYNRKIMYAEN